MPNRKSRLFSWLHEWTREELEGALVDIFITERAGLPMQRVTQARCLPQLGLEGDRYAKGQGHWIKTDGCEVTLITQRDVQAAGRRHGHSFDHGEHRRNLVVTGIPLEAFRQKQVMIGEVLFGFHRLRPPCGYLDRLLRPGAGKALGKGAGIGLHVLQEGVIRVGDPVRVLTNEAATAD